MDKCNELITPYLFVSRDSNSWGFQVVSPFSSQVLKKKLDEISFLSGDAEDNNKEATSLVDQAKDNHANSTSNFDYLGKWFFMEFFMGYEGSGNDY